MPYYPYRCQFCGTVHEPMYSILDELPVHITCECGGQMRRVFTAPSFHRFTEHHNATVGRPVSSLRDFKTKLHEAQEKMTERLGFQQHYSVADPTPITYEDKGMDATHDTRKVLGMST